MTRLNLALIFVVYAITSTGIVFAQDDFVQQGGTVRGQISDTTEMLQPIEGVTVMIVATDGTIFKTMTDANDDYEHGGIPAGRYLISIYKDGYGDRIGKAVTVVNVWDVFDETQRSRSRIGKIYKYKINWHKP